MEKEREDLVQELIERMMSITRKVRHDSTPSKPDLSMPQVHLLFYIADKQEAGATVSELADIIGVTPGAVSQFVNGLVDQGQVVREPDLVDRRIVRLRLTQAARDKFKQMRRDYLAAAARNFDLLTTKELHTLNNILARLNVPLEKPPRHEKGSHPVN